MIGNFLLEYSYTPNKTATQKRSPVKEYLKKGIAIRKHVCNPLKSALYIPPNIHTPKLVITKNKIEDIKVKEIVLNIFKDELRSFHPSIIIKR